MQVLTKLNTERFKATKRIHKEITLFNDAPPDYVPFIHVNETNMQIIYFLIRGPKDTPYDGGEYVVELNLPIDYPISPPSIKMRTPSGRFATGLDICTTFSNFHPESWSMVYTFTTILRSFLSFMIDDKPSHVGGIDTTIETKKDFALKSKEFNEKKNYNKMFY